MRRGASTARGGARRLAARVVGALALGCAAGAAAPVHVRLGERFELGVGESARIEPEALDVALVAVDSDSRCAVGVSCVWEGDAVVRLRVGAAGAEAQTLELHTAARERRAASYRGYGVRLVGLAPRPVAGRATPPEEYRASLEVARGEVGPER